MTNKEVINFLNQVRKILLDDKSWLESTIQPINEAFDMAINALTTQPETHDKRTEMHACDCVSRRAAIDALEKLSANYTGVGKREWHPHVRECQYEIEHLPSVQSTMGQQNDGDTISRRMAIDAMANTLWHYPNECYRNLNEYEFAKSLAELGLKSVPAAQPEIIHCKDCKFWREHKYAKETKRYIPFCGFNAIYTKSDDFCSRAERRTDG